MMDLIGFWTAVTSIVLPLVILLWLCIEVSIGHEVKVVTDSRADFSPLRSWWDEKIWRPAYRADIEFALMMVTTIHAAYAIIAPLLMLGAAHENSTTFLSVFADFCVTTAPFFSWVGVIAIVLIIQRMFVRPALKKMYAIKLKVDKL
jgi:hypothetical protein